MQVWMKDPTQCPTCGKKMEINGLYCFCKDCDYIDDSTFAQIMEDAEPAVLLPYETFPKWRR